jgi:beta-1,4-mannosyltransferase
LTVTVLVLGDLGRSPRILNHALMLAETGWDVALAGYEGVPIDNEVKAHPRINIFLLPNPRRAPEGSRAVSFLLISMLKVLELYWGVMELLLIRTPRANVILVQNPPSVPTLMAAWVAARLRGGKLLIDWHNFGFSMLALRLRASHPLVRISRVYEGFFGRLADAHFCVSKAMREVLMREIRVDGAVVLYDRPRETRALAPQTAHHDPLLVSPTSWTADEPMDVLLDALDIWDSKTRPCCLRVVISGRGALRESFERSISGKRWRFAEVQTVFLDVEGYRDLLRSADVGLSFHRSTSGVDLPMKTMDLLGAGAPVCAFDYGPCLTEQIQPGANGLFFRTGVELAARFEELFGAFPADDVLLQKLRQHVAGNKLETWRDVWMTSAAPVFSTLAGTRRP